MGTQSILLQETCHRLERSVVERSAVSFRAGRVISVNPAGDYVDVGCVGLNAGRTQQYLESRERTIGPPGTLENRRNCLRAQERFAGSLGCRRIQTSKQEKLSITA